MTRFEYLNSWAEAHAIAEILAYTTQSKRPLSLKKCLERARFFWEWCGENAPTFEDFNRDQRLSEAVYKQCLKMAAQ